jgi:NADPH-dependent ferric siderophore reductase
VAAIRTHLRNERGMPGKSICAIGYWQAERA